MTGTDKGKASFLEHAARQVAIARGLGYDRLKPYGEDGTMLDRPPAIADNALRRTSAWANTFLGRDHVTGRAPGTARGLGGGD
jgi:hypothetical protein